MRTNGRWEAVTVDSSESTFACFNCGTDDCNLKICPKPKNDAVIAKCKAKFEANKTTSNGRGSGGRGRSNYPEEVVAAKDEFMEGVVPQGGGHGRGRDSDNCDHTPPKANASHGKTVNGTKYKWCGICCKYWTWAHLMHEAKEHRTASRNKPTWLNLVVVVMMARRPVKTLSVTQGSDKKSKDSDSGGGFASYASLLRDFP